MKINKYIFREYDIRGKVSDDFPPEVVENLGKAFGTFISRSGGQEIALSGDVRLTTPSLIESFKTGGIIHRGRCHKYRYSSNPCKLLFYV